MLVKRPNEVIKVTFDFTRALEVTWRAGTEYSIGQYVRPTSPNGVEYECTAAGQSGKREPLWVGVSSTVSDGIGELVWTGRSFGDNATDTIQSRTVTASSGLTVANDQIAGETVEADISGGGDGSCYEVVCQIVTVNGETLELEEKVKVED